MIRVELSRSPRCFLLVRQTGASFEGALWRIRDPARDPKGEAPVQAFEQAVKRGDIPAGAKRSAWVRQAGRAGSLELLCMELLEKTVHEPRTTAWYVETQLEKTRVPA